MGPLVRFQYLPVLVLAILSINLPGLNLFTIPRVMAQKTIPSYSSGEVIQEMKLNFMKSFNESCLKHTSVQRYLSTLRDPMAGDRFIHFVFHEQGLKNGGLGDRLGGLVTAAMMAVRFNRTLLISSLNGFDKLFQPYPYASIQSDGNNAYNSYSYSRDKWTSWTRYNSSLADNDDTEHDLYFCINRNDMDRRCGMEAGDVKQPIIKLRGNRAYLCKWAVQQTTMRAFEELRGLGVDEKTDLLELGGCMLRLAMWPTEKLWGHVEEILRERENIVDRRSQSLNLEVNQSSVIGNQYQVGLHYRCGDIAFIHPREADRACTHDATGTDPHNEAVHMKYGTPIDLGNCARDAIRNHSRAMELGSNTNSSNTTASEAMAEALDYRIYIASDNPGAAAQMYSTLNITGAQIFPHGCHIQLNPSADCTSSTIAYWLLLALSDVIVTQTDERAPISAYSRYAAMYGLKKDSLRDARDCGNILSRLKSSRTQQGNWFCK